MRDRRHTRGQVGGSDQQGAVVTEEAASPAIMVRQLKKSYGLKPVLRSLNLVLQRGECMALLGANGSGKTTLLRILAGLMRPDSGTVTLLGCDLVEDAQELRRCVGLVAHQPYLYEELTVLENLLFFGQLYAVSDVRDRAYELLKRVGLEKRMHDRVRALSRGLLQRLAWVRALLHRPHLLLLDEPDTGLDQTGYERIELLLHEHRTLGGSILLTTHSLERALNLSDHITLLSAGQIAHHQPASELTLDSLQQVYQKFVG